MPKRSLPFGVALLLLTACAPVAVRSPQLHTLEQVPSQPEGKASLKVTCETASCGS